MFWRNVRSILSTLGFLLAFTAVFLSAISIWLLPQSTGWSDFKSNLEEYLTSTALGRDLTLGVLCAALGAWVFHLCTQQTHLQLFRVAKSSEAKRFYLSMLVVAAASVVVILFTAGFHLESFLGDPGGVFIILTGAFSVAGVYLTLINVLELRNSIVSFEDFIRRVKALVESTPTREPIDMLVLTPAMGCLVLDEDIWKPLCDILQEPKHKISLACLSESAMQTWFNCYLAAADPRAQGNMQKRIAKGMSESKEVLRVLDAQSDGDPGCEPLIGEWGEVPHTYLVASRTRAILAAPLFLPSPTFRLDPAHQTRTVQMIGFETSDVHVVESIRAEIRLRRTSLRRYADKG